jgi:hypothetical protein
MCLGHEPDEVDQSDQASLEQLQARLAQGTKGVMEKISHLPHVDLSHLQW